jgi:hypothetical protein
MMMHQMRISTNKVSSVMFRSKKLEIRKKKKESKTVTQLKKQIVMKLNQIRRRIELLYVWGS